jgi:hypothetical protein
LDKIDAVRLALSKGYIATSDGRIVGPSGKCLSEGKTSKGYKHFGIRNGSKNLNVSSHRFVAAFFHGEEVLDSECIRHKNDDKSDNRPENLEPGSSSDNFGDINEKWRQSFATKGAHTRRKLTDEQVQQIKLKLVMKYSLSSLASEYGVAKSTIQQIKEGKSYKWIE